MIIWMAYESHQFLFKQLVLLVQTGEGVIVALLQLQGMMARRIIWLMFSRQMAHFSIIQAFHIFHSINHVLIQSFFVPRYMQQSKQKVVVIGGGLSGLTAAHQILKKRPNTQITVLQANDYLGGRTKSVELNGCTFDEGAQFIGPTQHHVIDLAIQSKNQLVPVQCNGRKILEFKQGIGSYMAKIPNNVGLLALLQTQWTIWKINRMAQKVPSLNPRDCPLGHYWDSITLKSWLDQNVRFDKLKLMIEGAVRVIMGVQLGQVSMLYFLNYVNQSKDFDNLVTVEGGLQEKKTKLGTQHLSIYLGEQIIKKGGQIKLKTYVKSISQDQRKCLVEDHQGNQFQADYIIMAMPPCSAGKINFSPALSVQRRLICQRSFPGQLIKVMLLYKERYWGNKGFSGQSLSDCHDSPVMNGFDDSRVNHEGELQPALVVFIGGAVCHYWKDKQSLKESLVSKLATYYSTPQMLNPIAMHFRDWQEQQPIGGAPIYPFAPGTLAQIQDLRKPQGRIHWAGTELATVSTGFMDGAIESGKRVSVQVIGRMQGEKQIKTQKREQKQASHLSFNYGVRKYFEWW